MPHDGFTHESTYNESQEWYTPPKVFDAIGMRFDMDVCSPGAGVVPWIPAKEHLTFEQNGLVSPWHGAVWMNPPYGSDTPKWMSRFVVHHCGMALVFARTDTTWFHESAVECDGLLFLRGRLSFVPADGRKPSSAGAGSLLCACGEDAVAALRRARDRGLGFLVCAPAEAECHRDGSGLL